MVKRIAVIGALALLIAASALLAARELRPHGSADSMLYSSSATNLVNQGQAQMEVPIDEHSDELITPSAIDRSNLSRVIPLLEGSTFYYRKDSDIYKLIPSAVSGVETSIFLHVDEPIFAYAVSTDEQLVAYSVKRDAVDDNELHDGVEAHSTESQRGNIIIVHDRVQNSDRIIYEQGVGELQVRDIAFLPNSHELVFTNNAIWLADPRSDKVKSYLPIAVPNFCEVYYLNAINPSGRLLISKACYEGGEQLIFNVESGVKEGKTITLPYGDSGISVRGFTENDELLVDVYQASDSAPLGFQAYDLGIKNIFKDNVQLLPFDRTNYGSSYFAVSDQGTTVYFSPPIAALPLNGGKLTLSILNSDHTEIVATNSGAPFLLLTTKQASSTGNRWRSDLWFSDERRTAPQLIAEDISDFTPTNSIYLR